MNFNRNKHCSFVQRLDRTAEKCPLLWLPCVLMIALALIVERIFECARIAYRYRNTEKVIKEKPQVERKPLAMRVVAMTLVVALSFMFVPEFSDILSLDIFAVENWDNDFDLMEYIAYDIIYTKEDSTDETNFYSDYAKNTMDFYYEEFRSTAELWVDCMTPEFEKSVRDWENANLILSPGDAASKAIDAKGYYISIILNMMNSTFTSESITEKLNNKEVKSVSSVYNGFASLFKEMTNQDIADYLKKGKFTDDEKALLNSVQERYLSDNKLLSAGETASDIFFVLEAAQKPEEYIESFIEYCNVYNTTEEWKQFLQYMYNNCDKNNYALCSALETLIDVTKDINGSVRQLWQKGIEEVGSEVYQYCVDGAIDLIVSECNPFVKGMQIGAAIGKPLSNLISGTDGIVKGYYIVKAYEEIMQLLRGAYKEAENNFKANRNPHTAKVFINYVNMYFTALLVGNDYGLDFANAMCNGGILNKILYSKDQYERYVKFHRSFKLSITTSSNTVNNNWIYNLYFDRPDLYEIYAPIVIRPSLIDATRIEFEQDSVEWGLEDVEFNGANYTVYPKEATDNAELVITSSDESVAKMDAYGNVQVFKPGTCQIKVSVYWNELISDTLNVTVVEGNGADSVAPTKIDPITPDIVLEYQFEWEKVSDEGVRIIGYKGNETDVVIPSMIRGLPVISIGENAFTDNTNITSVKIPDSVKSIEGNSRHLYDGKGAFRGCTNLTDVKLGNGITSIGPCAFHGCSGLTSIAIPDSVTSIDWYAFDECTSLTNFKLGKNVTSIGRYAFQNCTSLTSVIIPDSVTSIDDYMFYGCTALTDVKLGGGVTSIGWYAFYGCTGLKSIAIPDSVTLINKYAFACCESLENIIIPNGVTLIDSYAFKGCNGLISLTILDSELSIRNNAFEDCINLINIDFGNNIISLGGRAFSGCCSLKSVTIPGSLDFVGDYLFADCPNLETITLEYGIKKIGIQSGLGAKNLKSINIPGSVKSIPYQAFERYKNLEEVILDEGIISIESEAFSSCPKIKSIDIPNSVTSIGDNAFWSCTGLENVNLGDNTTLIGKCAFLGCDKLKNIIIPNSVTHIESDAFACCDGLTQVTIPSGVIFIGESAFRECNNLTNVVISDSVKSMGERVFYHCINLKEVDIGTGVNLIGKGTFKECFSLTSIYIPDNITSIGNQAFYGCNNLTTVQIGNNTSSIGEEAFYNCRKLTDINIPKNVTSIGKWAFKGCENLKSITIPDNVPLIDYGTFYLCKNLEYIEIGNRVTSIGSHAFDCCESLTNIKIPNSVTSIGDEAFENCDSLTSVDFGNGLTIIGNESFANCFELTNIDFPDGLTTIGDSAFTDCWRLKSVKIPKSVTSIGERAFWECSRLTIYGYKNSYAETYANKNEIPFIALDDTPSETISSLIAAAEENSVITVDTSKYGDIVSPSDISAAKDKNLTLIINGNNYSWKVKATDLPNTSVDFMLISPSGEVDKTRFKEIYKNRSFDFKTVNPSGAELTYNVGAENNGCCANIFKVENGSFTIISSNMIQNGQTVFTPSDNSVYCIVVSADNEPIDIDDLFEKNPVESAVLNSLSVNNVNINDFSPDKLNYTYSVTYADWLADVSRTYNISASANDFVNVTVSENNFTLNSDNYDMAVSKDVTITATNSNGSETVYTIKFVVEACPHTIKNETISIEPTCTTLGEKETECSVCGKRFGVENIPALGHAFDNGTNTAESDCINMGTVLYQCSRCDESFTRTIPALGHNWGEVTVDTAADCTTDGISARYCAACGTRGYETLIPALGHSFIAWTKVDDITYERICTICGKKEIKTISNVEHDHIFNGTVDVIIPASCQAVGSQNIYCSVDGCTEFVTEEIAKTAHIPAEAVNINANCTTAGSSTIHCKECNTKLSETELSATGHSFTNYTDTATCTLPGKKTAMCDNGCGESDSIPTPAKGHSYGEWLNDITGHWHECSECGNKTSVISHSENDGVVTTPATETTSGVKTYSCSACDYVMRTEEIPPITHIHDLSSTYSSDKTGHWYDCSKCDEKVDFAAHTEDKGTVTIEATETTDGIMTYKCSVCGYVMRTKTIPAGHKHKFGTDWKTDRANHWHECTCGEKSNLGAHTEDRGTVTVQPTATTSGTKTYSCSECGYVMRTETLPTTGYNPYPSAPTYPVVSPVPITSESEIEVTLESDLSGISAGKIHFSTKEKFFKNSAVITVSNTETANNAASMAISYLSGDVEHNIIYPFDISIYNADTHEEMQLRERGYITFEIPVPDILSSKTDEIGVYHIIDGKPEAIKSRIVEKGGVNKIRFTAESFSPYMFAAYSENGMEDVSSGAGVTANYIPIDFAEPTTNGVGMPSARLPQIMKFSNKKRKYRILRKRRLDDLVFVF